MRTMKPLPQRLVKTLITLADRDFFAEGGACAFIYPAHSCFKIDSTGLCVIPLIHRRSR